MEIVDVMRHEEQGKAREMRLHGRPLLSVDAFAAARVRGSLPAVYGPIGRALTPELYVTGETDAVVLELPKAAFMSTASGLLVFAGTISYDVRNPARRGSVIPPARRIQFFRMAAVLGLVVPALLALSARGLDISILVGWAFALAASTFCPLFLLGIWWSGLTARGAVAGVGAGGVPGDDARLDDRHAPAAQRRGQPARAARAGGARARARRQPLIPTYRAG